MTDGLAEYFQTIKSIDCIFLLAKYHKMCLEKDMLKKELLYFKQNL